jgi:hypothetical protein
MGLKGYRLWVVGQLDSNVQRPASGGKSPTKIEKSPPPGVDPAL